MIAPPLNDDLDALATTAPVHADEHSGFATSIPLGVYIHLPWCVRKCPYCDFNSHEAAQIPESAYLAALEADLDAQLPAFWGRRPHSVFLGGGTPSRFSGAAIARILELLRSRLKLSPNAEVTLEANPGAFDEAHFRAYREAGVNRLSIGVQSFDDARLAALGRIHHRSDAERAFHSAREAGFERINLDLMFALPASAIQGPQSVADALDDLDRAIALEPEHISWYQLTLEPNTLFAARPPALPDDDRAADIFAAGRDRLAQADYRRYEISAYAKPGEASRHNLNYWQFGDYIGIGAGAHGKCTDLARGDIIRIVKPRQPGAYMATPTATTATPIAAADRLFESLLNGLRLIDGIRREDITGRSGCSPLTLDHAVAPLLEAGGSNALLEWVQRDGETRLRAAPQAIDHLDQILTHLLPQSR